MKKVETNAARRRMRQSNRERNIKQRRNRSK